MGSFGGGTRIGDEAMTDIGFYRAQGEYGFMSNMYLAEIEFEGKR